MKAWFFHFWRGDSWQKSTTKPKTLGGVQRRVIAEPRAWLIHQWPDGDWVTLDRRTGESFMRNGRATPLFEDIDPAQG